MIEALISGKLQGRSEQRTGKTTGKAYVQARLRVSAGADDTHFIRVTAFSESVCSALLALDDGDALAVAGTLKVGAWLDREGAAKPNLDMVAAQVLTAYGVRRKREAVHGEQRPAQAPRQAHAGGDDFGHNDDAWLAGDAP